MPVSFQARVVYPVIGPPIEHGIVTIAGERIVAVGRAAEAPLQDLGDVALLPAFVNTHTHLEFSHRQKPLGQPGLRLVDWIRLVIAERKRSDERAIEAIQAGLKESAAAGVAALGEIVSTPAAVASYSQFPAPCSLLFQEVIGFSQARAESALLAMRGQLAVLLQAPANIGISPHAPYTVSPHLLQELVSLADNQQLPVAMHLAESAEELELLANGTGPFHELLDERSMWDPQAIPPLSLPLDYLQMLSAAPRALIIHGNYLSAEEHAFLAAHADRMSLVYCPRTHTYFQHPPYPLAELLAARVQVALGTDSRASNPDLDLFAEMQHVARTQPAVDPLAILEMGTQNGAKALGIDTGIGSLTPGKSADFVALPLPAAATGTPRDLLSALLANPTGPRRIWQRGEERPRS